MLLTVLVLQLVTMATPTELEARWQGTFADGSCADVVLGHATVALAGPAMITTPFAASLLRAGRVTQVQTLADKPDVELRASAQRVGASTLIRFEAIDDGARAIVKRMVIGNEQQTAFILEAGAPCPTTAPVVVDPAAATAVAAPVAPVAPPAPVAVAASAEQEAICKRDRLNVRTRQSLQGGAYGNVVSIRSVDELVLSSGKYEQRLAPVDFLQQAGAVKEAADLRHEEDNRFAVAVGSLIAGGVITTGGLAALLVGFTADDFSAGIPLIIGGSIATMVGPVVMLVGPIAVAVAPLSLDPARMRQIADEHNVKIGCPDP